MWIDRLGGEAAVQGALEELWPYALGVLPEELRPRLAERVGLAAVEAVERSEHPELAELWAEMTVVRRSAPGAQW